MKSSVVHAIVGVWLLVVSAGIVALTRYKGLPGAPAHAPPSWPAETHVRRAEDRATLVMLAHPRCPCTRASIAELAELMERVGDRVSVHVLFVHPAGTSRDWHETDVWRSANALPGVDVVEDVDGVEAKRFGAETSGQTLVYDARGRLVFSGGITPARGHAGYGAERDQLATLIVGAGGNAPVFGCELREGAK